MTVSPVPAKPSIHPLYHVLARVNLAWSDNEAQAYQRARATMNQMVLTGHVTGGFWDGDDYCVRKAVSSK